jgi:hypothetical protein
MILPLFLLLAQSPQEARVAEFLQKGELMEADGAAVQLEQCAPGVRRDEWTRRIQIGGQQLTFKWFEPAGCDYYQHDIAMRVAKANEGKPLGADALVAALRSVRPDMIFGRQDQFLFRTVIDLLEARPWRELHDWRMDEILGEAYETWWSLSLMKDDDNLITVGGFKRTDFEEGAAEAQRKAIAAYERVVAAGHGEPDMIVRLADIRMGRDTGQRAWMPDLD